MDIPSSDFERTNVGMVRTSIEGEFFQVNDAFCRMIGYSREELLAKSMSCWQLTHPDDLESSKMKHQLLLVSLKKNLTMEKRYLHKQGKVVWISLSVCLLHDNHGNPQYFVGTATDITDQKLKACSQNIAVAMPENTPDTISISDLEGHIQNINSATIKHAVYETHEIIGQTNKVINRIGIGGIVSKPFRVCRMLTATGTVPFGTATVVATSNPI